MRKTLTLALLLIGTIISTSAQLNYRNVFLASPWGDNAVLKQNSEVTLQGWGYPASNVQIVASWNISDTVYVKVSNQGKFTAKIKTSKGSYDPQTIYFNGQPLMQNVLVGEVWVCSGQSNMQWNVDSGIENGEQHASEATNDYIRILNVPLCAADTPQETVVSEWESCTPQTMRRASAVGYFFARELQQTLGVPVGIISTAWGGAVAESFVASEVIYGDMELTNNAMKQESQWRDERPGKIYNAMIAPLTPYTVSGTIWYQGESNVQKWSNYARLMEALVRSWRTEFKQPELPFYMVQIAPFNYGAERESAPLRIMQEKASKNLENCEFITVSDITGNINDIHPRNKLDVGKRLAALALAKNYDTPTAPYQYPTLKEVQILKNGKVIATFDNLVGNLTLPKGETSVNGLTIVDQQGTEHKATAVINGAKLEISAKGVKQPKAVRYCYDNTTIGNLFSSEMLPVATFNSEML